MADDGFAPDEWDPPQLSRHMPFPPPVVFDLDVFDTAPLLFVLLEAGLRYNGWHGELPSWFVPAVAAFCAVWLANALIRPQDGGCSPGCPCWGATCGYGRRRPCCCARSRIAGPSACTAVGWSASGRSYSGATRAARAGQRDHRRRRRAGHSAGSGASRLVRFVRWLLAIAQGQETLVQLLWVSDTGSLDLLDPEAREGVWAARQELLARPDHRLSLYLRVRPFPLDDVVRAAGPVGEASELREWATTRRSAPVTTADFTAHAQRHSSAPLDDFFTAWLYETRLPPPA